MKIFRVFSLLPIILSGCYKSISVDKVDLSTNFYQDNELSVYKISYPNLQRSLKIYYHREFPYKIEKWIEITTQNGKEYTTAATKTIEIKTDYWNKNSNKDLPLREQLKLSKK